MYSLKHYYNIPFLVIPIYSLKANLFVIPNYENQYAFLPKKLPLETHHL